MTLAKNRQLRHLVVIFVGGDGNSLFCSIGPLNLNRLRSLAKAQHLLRGTLGHHPVARMKPTSGRHGALRINQANPSAQAPGQGIVRCKSYPNSRLPGLTKIDLRLAKRLRRDDIGSAVAIEIDHQGVPAVTEDGQTATPGPHWLEPAIALAKQDHPGTRIQPPPVRSKRI